MWPGFHSLPGNRAKRLPFQAKRAELESSYGPCYNFRYRLLAYSVAVVSSNTGFTGGIIGSSGYPITASTMR